MSGIDYRRRGVSLRIVPSSDGGVEIGSDGTDGSPPWHVGLSNLDLAEMHFGLSLERPVFDRFHAPTVFLGRLRSMVLTKPPLPDSRTGNVDLLRLVLHVAGSLSGYAWEPLVGAMLGAEFRALPIVRVASVWPRVAARPFTLPLRMLQLDPAGSKIEEGVEFWLLNAMIWTAARQYPKSAAWRTG